jgi:hypothetical protein
MGRSDGLLTLSLSFVMVVLVFEGAAFWGWFFGDAHFVLFSFVGAACFLAALVGPPEMSQTRGSKN